MGRNYVSEYEKMIGREVKVPAERIQPHRLYRLYNYTYRDGKYETFRGTDATLIFCTGIYKQKVSALKISMFPPDVFFSWFGKLIKNNEILESKLSLFRLDKLAPKFDVGGKVIWDRYIHNNISIRQGGDPYRTYLVKGISHITEAYIKKQFLVKYFGDD